MARAWCHGEATTPNMARRAAAIARGGEAGYSGGTRDGRRQEEGGDRGEELFSCVCGGGKGTRGREWRGREMGSVGLGLELERGWA